MECLLYQVTSCPPPPPPHPPCWEHCEHYLLGAQGPGGPRPWGPRAPAIGGTGGVAGTGGGAPGPGVWARRPLGPSRQRAPWGSRGPRQGSRREAKGPLGASKALGARPASSPVKSPPRPSYPPSPLPSPGGPRTGGGDWEQDPPGAGGSVLSLSPPPSARVWDNLVQNNERGSMKGGSSTGDH